MATDQEVKRILDQHADALSQLPNVVGMGVVDDAPGESAVAVYVSAKVPAEQLSDAELVPKELEVNGVSARTHVIEIGTITPQ